MGPWQDNGFGGIYGYGMTNNFIGNRIAGHEAGMWFPGHLQPTGKGGAVGKVCPQFLPFGTFDGNVCHSCGQFGLYLEHQQSRNVQRDENGYVVGHDTGNMASCEQFTATGEDNGKISVIVNHLDWHNVYTGGYEFTDIRFKDLTTVNQRNHIHWRNAKDLVRTAAIGDDYYHIENGVFLQSRTGDDFGDCKLLLPGGNVNFEFSSDFTIIKGDRSMPGEAVFMAPEECGMNSDDQLIVDGISSLCTTTVNLSGINRSGVASDLQLLGFGGRDAGDATAVSYKIDNDYHFSTLYDGFLGLEACSLSTGDIDNSIACTNTIVFGRLYIWTAAEDMGTLQLDGPGYTGAVANADYSNVNAGSLIYDCTTGNHLKWYCGYGAHVQLDGTYDVSGLTSSTEGVKFVLRNTIEPLLVVL